MRFLSNLFLTLGFGASLLCPAYAKGGLLEDPVAEQKVLELATELADAHPDVVSGVVKREDVITAFARGLVTSVGIFAAIYSVPSENPMPLASALFIAAAGGLTTSGFQLNYEPVVLWQTHWIDWKFEKGLPKLSARLEHGPMMLMFKEFNLQLFFYSAVNLAFWAVGEGSNHIAQTFSDASWGLVLDGAGNILLSTQVVKMVSRIHKRFESGTLGEIEARQKQRRIWAIGKFLATAISAGSTALILLKNNSLGADYSYLSDAASMTIYTLAIAFGGGYLVQVINNPKNLQRELKSLVRACRKVAGYGS